MSEHAILSASGAHRWLSCTPSARLELEFDDSSGEAALEGTLDQKKMIMRVRIKKRQAFLMFLMKLERK